MSGPGGLPAWAKLVLRLSVRKEHLEFLLGDLEEGYALEVRRRPEAAGRWLRRQVAATWIRWHAAAALRRVPPGTSKGWGAGGMGSVIQDTKEGLRSIMRRRGMALVVALTLGLGIGATTTIYSVVDGVLLRPLPYEDPHELVAVGTTFPGREWVEGTNDLMRLAGTSLLNYQDMKARVRSFDTFGAVEWTSMLLPDQGDGPELVTAARVDAGFFETLRVGAGLGRLFTPDEYGDGARPLLLSHGAWQRRFGQDPSVLGKTLGSGGTSPTVVGVLPEDFQPPEAMFGDLPEFWLPLQVDHARYADRGRRSLVLVARLAAGVTLSAAREELRFIAEGLAADFPEGNVYPDGSRFGAGVNSLHRETVGTTGRILGIFLASATMLLLIAILNAASLLLARAMDRARELGVRAALGAGGFRIARLLLAESLLLSAMGGGVGIALAYVGVEAFHRFGPTALPRMDAVVVDGRVLAMATVVVVLTGMLAGIVPAARVTGQPLWERLRSGGEWGASAPGRRLRSFLVASQLGLAVLLLSAAGLLFHSFVKLKTTDPGFEPEGLLTFEAVLKRSAAEGGEPPWHAWNLLLDEVRAVPGLMAAGTSNVPFQPTNWAPRVLLPGDAEDYWREGIVGYAVTPDYFDVVGTRRVHGRSLESRDGPDGPFVAVVNEAFVTRYLAGLEPLGVELRLPEGQEGASTTVEIVGVVRDVVQARPEDGIAPAIYVPHTQADWPLVRVVIRSGLPSEVLIPELRRAVARFSPSVPPLHFATMDDRIAATRTDPRFRALLLGTFATVALLLSAAGLFASLSHAVTRRRRELGIRMTLGLGQSGVLGLVLLEGLRVAGAGLGIGLTAAVATNHVLGGFLYGVDPVDAATLGTVAVLLAMVAAGASMVPAWRATVVDPVAVLKEQ